jgi:hypothetical protein
MQQLHHVEVFPVSSENLSNAWSFGDGYHSRVYESQWQVGILPKQRGGTSDASVSRASTVNSPSATA